MRKTDNYNADLTSGIAAFDSKNFALAYQLLAPLATEGDKEALFRIAIMQNNGLGMVANQQLALDNFKRAARLGHSFAHHMLGIAYLEGEGVEKNINTAISWLEKAAEFELEGSMLVLSMLYADGNQIAKDNKKAKYWADRATKSK